MVVKVVRRNDYDEFLPDENEQMFHEAIPGTLDRPGVTYVDRSIEPNRTEVVEREHAGQSIYFVVGLIETILALRLAFRFLNGSLANGFVQAIYLLSYPLVQPFAGIFNMPINDPTGRLEVATVFAMVMYVVIGGLLIQLMRAVRGKRI